MLGMYINMDLAWRQQIAHLKINNDSKDKGANGYGNKK
jgi:hypothetical protein